MVLAGLKLRVLFRFDWKGKSLCDGFLRENWMAKQSGDCDMVFGMC